MSSHIEVTPSASRLSADVRSFIDTLERIVNDVGDIKSIMDQVALGGDYDSLGTKLGVSAADAEAVYNLIGSVKGELEATFITQLTSRCG